MISFISLSASALPDPPDIIFSKVSRLSTSISATIVQYCSAQKSVMMRMGGMPIFGPSLFIAINFWTIGFTNGVSDGPGSATAGPGEGFTGLSTGGDNILAAFSFTAGTGFVINNGGLNRIGNAIPETGDAVPLGTVVTPFAAAGGNVLGIALNYELPRWQSYTDSLYFNESKSYYSVS